MYLRLAAKVGDLEALLRISGLVRLKAPEVSHRQQFSADW